MNKIFIDTLYLIALINPKDQYHKKALFLGNEYKHSGFLTTDIILLEVGNALAKNYKNQALQLINTLLTSPEVEIINFDVNLLNKALILYEKYQDKSWGLVDCCSFIVMKENNINQALTFDNHFIQAGFNALMR